MRDICTGSLHKAFDAFRIHAIDIIDTNRLFFVVKADPSADNWQSEKQAVRFITYHTNTKTCQWIEFSHTKSNDFFIHSDSDSNTSVLVSTFGSVLTLNHKTGTYTKEKIPDNHGVITDCRQIAGSFYALNSEGIIFHLSNGAQWERWQQLPTKSEANSIDGFSETDVYVGADNGLWHYAGRDWERVAIPSRATNRKKSITYVYCDPIDHKTVYLSKASTYLIVGNQTDGWEIVVDADKNNPSISADKLLRFQNILLTVHRKNRIYALAGSTFADFSKPLDLPGHLAVAKENLLLATSGPYAGPGAEIATCDGHVVTWHTKHDTETKTLAKDLLNTVDNVYNLHQNGL